jgi:hypothetical protein
MRPKKNPKAKSNLKYHDMVPKNAKIKFQKTVLIDLLH